MGKYWYRCEKCNKKIKKTLTHVGITLCRDCKKEIKYCLNCGNILIGGKKIRKYCSKKCSGEHIGKTKLTGRTLSNEHKENLSKAAWNYKSNYHNVKYYKVYCPFLMKEISVQGTYEREYAKYLNENNILWNRGKKISLQYKKNENCIVRNYYPDFYLISTDEFIETKGYYSETDKVKMKLVLEQNPNKTIKILFKKDLIVLGLNI